jgi:hypothetical protein
MWLHALDLRISCMTFCNVPKPRCKEHHGFGVVLNFYWLWYFVKHFAYNDPLGCD